MKTICRIKPSGLLLLSCLLVPVQALAQNQTVPCTASEHFSDFDFWLGEWDVSAAANGNTAGHNVISKELGNCLIRESWQGSNGSQGSSINYFNPLRDEWRQLWVAPGYIIDISGGLQEGSMVLSGHIDYFNDKSYQFRGTWTPRADGSVRQFFEQYDAEQKQWQPWFDGIYVKAGSAAKQE